MQVCCPAQVQRLVQQLAEVEAARDALEARLAALSAGGDADALAAADGVSRAHSNSEGGSTLQKARLMQCHQGCVGSWPQGRDWTYQYESGKIPCKLA